MREFYAFVLASAFPVVIALVFPFEALRFRLAPAAAPCPAICSFVELSDAERQEALAAARSAWRVDVASARRLRVDMAVGELPETRMPSVLSSAPVAVAPVSQVTAYDVPPMPRTVAAPPADRMPRVAPGPARPAFSREELLKID